MTIAVDYYSVKVVAVNLRYLCWKQQKDRSQWPALLASWLGGKAKVEMAIALLSDTQLPKPEQIEAIVRALNIDEQDLVFANLLDSDGVNLLKLNLKRLLCSPGKQSKGALAKEIGVSPATLSRWISGKQDPDSRAKHMIATLFGLRGEAALTTRPLFLSYLPVTYGEQVVWLNMCLNEISANELMDLFPALYRMFSSAGNQSVERTMSGLSRRGSPRVNRQA